MLSLSSQTQSWTGSTGEFICYHSPPKHKAGQGAQVSLYAIILLPNTKLDREHRWVYMLSFSPQTQSWTGSTGEFICYHSPPKHKAGQGVQVSLYDIILLPNTKLDRELRWVYMLSLSSQTQSWTGSTGEFICYHSPPKHKAGQRAQVSLYAIILLPNTKLDREHRWVYMLSFSSQTQSWTGSTGEFICYHSPPKHKAGQGAQVSLYAIILLPNT